MDAKGFEDWVRDHHADLYRHALWLVGDADLAEELVQETFYRAWRGRGALRRRQRPLPWLLGILRRACFAEIARRGRYAPETYFEAGAPGGEDVAHLARALARLDPAQRDILLLYALHGLSYAEIARQLDIPQGTVMSRLARARAALRKAWGGPWEEAAVIPFPGSRR